MLGGATIVRLVVLQESNITASAIAPPAPQKKVSRLPWTHRVSLEARTNREYAQKHKIITTHFFRFFLMPHTGWLICTGASFAKQNARNVEPEIGAHLTKQVKERSMEYLILLAVVAAMALYALIIAICLKQPEW